MVRKQFLRKNEKESIANKYHMFKIHSDFVISKMKENELKTKIFFENRVEEPTIKKTKQREFLT